MDKKLALQKAQAYCAKCERCHWEVWQKLRDWGVRPYDANDIIASLIAENFLNEQRFASSFVSDKFRLQGWGRIKIVQHLKAKHISEAILKEALERIEEDAYGVMINKLAKNKLKLLRRETDKQKRYLKLRNFLLQRGFEPNLVAEVCSGHLHTWDSSDLEE